MHTRQMRILIIAVTSVWVAAATANISSAIDPRLTKHLAAGEFSVAKQLAAALPLEQRDAALGQIALRQAAAGDVPSATQTALSRSAPTTSSLIEIAGRDAGSAAGAKGGGSMADFSSLMELIQTTISPETWEDLGGPSTMSPYPAGVLVDAQGMIHPVQVVPQPMGLLQLRNESLRALGEHPGDGSPRHWFGGAAMRKVSLGRLQRELQRCILLGIDPTEAMHHLAGLSRIEYVFIRRDVPDVIVAGPVGGIRIDDNKCPVDVTSGQVPLTLDLLGFAVQAANEQREFGCTIEPTPEGITRIQKVSQAITSGKLAALAASDELRSALGPQNIKVFGAANDSAMAMLMVQADRHMKLLALGQQEMPRGVSNYMDFVKSSLSEEPAPSGFLRLWFAPQPIKVRCDADFTAFELTGIPLQLKTQRELADAQGIRHAARVDTRAENFTKEFNEHFADIAGKYPIYDRLRGLYDLTALAQLVCQQLEPAQRVAALGSLMHPDAWARRVPHPPGQTESLVVYRSFRVGKLKHSVVMASGGVEIDPALMIQQSPQAYPALVDVRAANATAPERRDHWWWD